MRLLAFVIIYAASQIVGTVSQSAASFAMSRSAASSATPAYSTGLPANTTDDPIDPDVYTFAAFWGWAGCNSKDKEIILGGLSEAHRINIADGVKNIDSEGGTGTNTP